MHKTDDSLRLTPANLQIIIDHLPQTAFFGDACFKSRASEQVIDTVIIHSCYVPDGVIAPNLALIPEVCTEETARALGRRWKDGGSVDADVEFAALHTLIVARRGAEGLHPYSCAGIRDIFEFYGVSAHYLIDRAGNVFELVDPVLVAFHAGKSAMPRAEDGRSGVNAFGIGIELLATTDSGYTSQQLQALTALSNALMKRFPIENLYGHSDIAPGRKSDPHGFDWRSLIASLTRAPLHSAV